MKIALLGTFPIINHTTFNKKKERPQTWNINLAEGLAKLDQEVCFLTFTKHFSEDYTHNINDRLKIHYLHVPHGYNYLTFYQYGKARIHSLLNKLNPDFVLGIGTEHEYPYIAAASKFSSAIYIHHLLKMHFENIKEKKNIKTLYKIYFENRALKLTKNIFSTTDLFRDSIDLRNKHYAVIENSVNNIFFEQASQIKSEQFLFVGKADDGRKRLADLIDATALIRPDHKDIKLYVFGPMNEMFYKKIMSKIQKLNLIKNVKLLGFVEDNKLIAEEMSKSVATCVISDFEGFGMPVAESLSVGTPVIASRVGGIPYILEDGKSGFLVKPRDITEIAEKMKLLLNDSNLRQAMGFYGKETAKNRFTDHIIASKMLRYIKEWL